MFSRVFYVQLKLKESSAFWKGLHASLGMWPVGARKISELLHNRQPVRHDSIPVEGRKPGYLCQQPPCRCILNTVEWI
jgi:hypothetical protein